MKLASYTLNGRPSWGVVADDQRIIDVRPRLPRYHTLLDVLRAGAMDQAVQDAKDRVTNGLAAVGKVVGNFVPGIGAISEQASQGLAAVLGTLSIGTSAVALRSRARRKEADEKAKENEQKFVQTVESVEALRKIDPAVAESMSKNKGVMWEALDEKTWEAIKLVQARVGAK